MTRKRKPTKRIAAKKKSRSQLIVSVAGVESRNSSSDIVGEEHPQHFHAIPDITDLVNRGGLNPSDGAPFKLGDFGEDLTMDMYGANTLTMVALYARTFEKDVFAARQICIAHPEVSLADIEERYRESFGFMGREWIQRNIIDRKDATDHREMAHEIDDKLRSYPTIGRALEKYPLTERDTRPDEANALSVGSAAELSATQTIEGKQDATSPKQQQHKAAKDHRPNAKDLEMANRKMADPVTYSWMTPKDAMAALGLSKSAIYDHPLLEQVPTGNKSVRFTTKSVIDIKNLPPK